MRYLQMCKHGILFTVFIYVKGNKVTFVSLGNSSVCLKETE